MYKNRKKGFSLIELLAVVIILAILALILIPFIGNLIKQAKINSAVVSAYGYVEAANNEIVSKQTKGEYVAETTYNIEDFNIVGNLLNVKYEGRGPDKGYFNVGKVRVTDGVFCINGYEIKYSEGKAVYNPNGSTCQAPPAKTVCSLLDGTYTYEDVEEVLINKADDLYCLVKLVNDRAYTFQGKTVLLNADIDLADRKSYSDESEFYDEEKQEFAEFRSIGLTGATFSGTFKGNPEASKMYTISNININKSSNYLGLFSKLASTSTVGGFNLDHITIRGNQYVGGIAGENQGKIYAINVTNGSVSGSSNIIGGIAGNNTGIIKEVAYRGNVSGSGRVGGAAGTLGTYDQGGTVDGVIVKGNISGWDQYTYAGGLVGGSTNSTGVNGTIYGAYLGGTISGRNNVGKANGSRNLGLVYTSSAVTKTGSGSSGDGNGYNADYHSIGMFDDVLDTVYGGDSDRSGYYFDYDENDELVVMKVNDHSFDTQIRGTGTESDPYILATERDFKDVAIIGKTLAYYKIANDLDISTFTHFYPLGTYNNYFSGYVDGNNKTISNMNLNGGRYGGFIGYLNSGNIKNLTFDTSTIRGRYGNGSKTGLVIGYAGTTTIENVILTNIAEVSGSDYVGALIGQIGANSTINPIPNISGIKVSGTDYVGGISGHIGNNTTLSNFPNQNNITITGSGNYVGGIVGVLGSGITIEGFDMDNVKVSGAANVGGVAGQQSGKILGMNLSSMTVSGSGYNIGGFAGLNLGAIQEVTYRGSVSGQRNLGGIAGGNGPFENTASIRGALVNANVSGWDTYTNSGGIAGGSSNGSGYTPGIILGVVEGGTINGNRNTGKGTGDSYNENVANAKIYVSSAVTSKASNGREFNADYHSIGMFDDVLDTVYGGDSDRSGYYFDYDENDELVVMKVNDHSFDTQIRGTGTESDPYILATERDFKDVAIIGKTLAYYKIANDLDISTFTHFYPLGTYNNYFSGYVDGNNKTISNMNLNGGRYGGFIGYLNSGNIKNLTFDTSTIRGRYGNGSKTGLVIGYAGTTTIENVILTNIAEVSGSDYVGALIGQIGANSTINPIPNISGIKVSGTDYVGGISGHIGNNTTLSNFPNQNNITITGSGNYVGGIVGVLGSGITIEGFDMDNVKVSGAANVGGVAGQQSGKILGMNLSSMTVSGSGYNIGGFAGLNLGAIQEVTYRGSVSGQRNLGGIAGGNGPFENTASIRGALVNANVSGWDTYTNSGGIAGGSSNGSGYTPGYISAVMESGNITGNRNTGRATGDSYQSSRTTVLVSSAVTTSGTANGTTYSADEGSLYYFGTVKYENKPLLESSDTGDVNNSGYWFAYDANGLIKVVRVGSTTPTPNPPVCEGDCTNPSTYPLESNNVTGTCPSGDVTPPTCTFNEFVAVINGIRASFSCTDDTSVPTVASMFNSTTKEIYTFEQITDQERGGTVKNGSVSGNTRNITSTWTTTTVPSNPPQRGLCYYYQMAAKDECGNEGDYTTSYCYYGFSN